MRIKEVLATAGAGAWYSTDLEAVRQGAKTDDVGLLFRDPPVTPGFDSVRQPSAVVCVMLVMDDGQIACGDCAATIFPGRLGKDKQVVPAEVIDIVECQVGPQLVGRDVSRFRDNDAFLRSLSLDGAPLGASVLYGLSQALLSAAALANKSSMAEVLCREWAMQMAATPIPLNLQTGPDWARGIDKIILRRGASIHTRNPHNPAMFAAVPEALAYIRNRLSSLAPPDYRPMVHMGLYGLAGSVIGFDVGRIYDYLCELEAALAPYVLVVSDAVEMETRAAQIEKLAAIRRLLGDGGSTVKLMAEQFCLTESDHRAFRAAKAVDYQKIRPPDLGSFGAMMDIAAIRKENAGGDLRFYLAGSATETETAARARAHLAMATDVDLMLAGPGMGVDEAHSIVGNEMQRILRLHHRPTS